MVFEVRSAGKQTLAQENSNHLNKGSQEKVTKGRQLNVLRIQSGSNIDIK